MTAGPLPPEIAALLACPRTGGALVYFPRGESGHAPDTAFLLCPSARLRYPVEDGVPVLLAEAAQEVSADEVERLLARARALELPIP